ncbi:hypothetical protein Ccrd_013292 [Cynara cardunculus var. scolymus]|uniref:Uncharacterized protein n=1 Tax=Cynara cardunculus var. scolymus TaxID=59895 RepID=A0A124SH40_CYNCS|nr:hypothetical protein Ccrd_013292 [Cynara cardunculus var. scolymus]
MRETKRFKNQSSLSQGKTTSKLPTIVIYVTLGGGRRRCRRWSAAMQEVVDGLCYVTGEGSGGARSAGEILECYKNLLCRYLASKLLLPPPLQRLGWSSMKM